MNNMNQMMKQAKKMQEQMMKAQEQLGELTVEGVAGGVVTIVMNGHKMVQNISIKPEAVDPDDVEMLQDLLLTAFNDALTKVDEVSNKELGRLTGGLKIPGLF